MTPKRAKELRHVWDSNFFFNQAQAEELLAAVRDFAKLKAMLSAPPGELVLTLTQGEHVVRCAYTRGAVDRLIDVQGAVAQQAVRMCAELLRATGGL